MPRKKFPIPKPIEVYDYGDIVIEVYRDDELPASRGSHNKYKAIQTFYLALELLWNAKQDSLAGIRRQFFVDIRLSAAALERALTKQHGRRHSIQIQQRICRRALYTYGLTGDDQVRLPYVFDSQKNRV